MHNQLSLILFDDIKREFEDIKEYHFRYSAGKIICYYCGVYLCLLNIYDDELKLWSPRIGDETIYSIHSPNCFELLYHDIREDAKVSDIVRHNHKTMMKYYILIFICGMLFGFNIANIIFIFSTSISK